MKITKQGEPPDTVYEGRCEECGCEFECAREETVVGAWRYADCPNKCGHLVQVYRLTDLRKMAREQEKA